MKESIININQNVFDKLQNEQNQLIVKICHGCSFKNGSVCSGLGIRQNDDHTIIINDIIWLITGSVYKLYGQIINSLHEVVQSTKNNQAYVNLYARGIVNDELITLYLGRRYIIDAKFDANNEVVYAKLS